MIPLGRSSATRLADRSWRTIWQKTFCSRTRRAMSWPYCEPKSKIRMRSLSGNDVILLHCFCGWWFGIQASDEQFLKHLLVVHLPITDEALDINLTVLEEI